MPDGHPWEKTAGHRQGGPGIKPIRPEFLAATLSELAADDALFFADTGTACIWLARHIKGGPNRRLFGSSSWASMANAAPNGFGAQLAYPGRQTIALCGDGGFTMLALGDLLPQVQPHYAGYIAWRGTVDEALMVVRKQSHRQGEIEIVLLASGQVFAEYVDTGFSGAAASRPQLDRLLRDARLQRFEAVLVWKLDRWGRRVAHSVRSIQELVSLGIRFLSPTESIDTWRREPYVALSFALVRCLCRVEREIIGERVRAGVRNAKAKGTRLGRPQRVFRRAEAHRLREQELSWREIARVARFADLQTTNLLKNAGQRLLVPT